MRVSCSVEGSGWSPEGTLPRSNLACTGTRLQHVQDSQYPVWIALQHAKSMFDATGGKIVVTRAVPHTSFTPRTFWAAKPPCFPCESYRQI